MSSSSHRYNKGTFCHYSCNTLIKFDKSRVPKAATKWKVKPRKYCNQEIIFDDYVIAPSRKIIPLNQADSYHECPKGPFKSNRAATLGLEF
jgi:hypothetical protein